MSSAIPIESSGPARGGLVLNDVGFSRLYRDADQDLVVYFARRTYDAHGYRATAQARFATRVEVASQLRPISGKLGPPARDRLAGRNREAS